MVCRLRLFGPIKVESQTGTDLTPTSLKARGLLALLASAASFRMTRDALIDKLWSDRGPEQGSNSLRQALRAIRQDIGQEIFVNGNGWIALDPAVIVCDWTPLDPTRPNAEFAADLNGIKDPEFEAWLRDIRSYYEAHAPQVQAEPGPQASQSAKTGGDALPQHGDRPFLRIGDCLAMSGELRLRGAMVMEQAAARAAQLTNAVVLPSEDSRTPPTCSTLSCRILEMSGRIELSLTVRSTLRDEFWTQRFSAPVAQSEILFDEALDVLTSALVSSVASDAEVSPETTEGFLSFEDIFSFDAARLYRADDLLRQRYERQKRPEFLALRAYIRHTLLMERLSADPGKLLDEAHELASAALARGPHIGVVLALSSMIYGLRGDDEFALDLAMRAAKADPGHSLVHHSLSTAYSFVGRQQDALAEARKAGKANMSLLTPAITSLRSAYAAIGTGNQAEALRHAEIAVASAPNIRAAHRVVAALRFASGDEEGAAQSLLALQQVEPDFSLELMSDGSYPVDTLRSYGLLAITKSGLL